MIRRRSFLMGCGGIVAAPAFARVVLPLTAWRQPRTAGLPASTALATVIQTEDVVLRIDGWDSAADPGDVWVQINSSWRANWR